MKNDNKRIFILYVFASVCFFISSILNFISKSGMGINNLALGICFFCIAITYYEKYKKEK